ncbi:D-alanyl-D-alanine carboxypeptidase/D-alanyl-D-alanine-endopeptidase, partial [Actinokineospora sp. PR83]|uniref:D-alanyl-D-alanine carboxypeptidase/D-alanyl-D-alanine endopeptidase n=1 Tax=Actinokineospora sp. PR83 TaxID=2884908 RepID=UPI001F4879B5
PAGLAPGRGGLPGGRPRAPEESPAERTQLTGIPVTRPDGPRPQPESPAERTQVTGLAPLGRAQAPGRPAQPTGLPQDQQPDHPTARTQDRPTGTEDRTRVQDRPGGTGTQDRVRGQDRPGGTGTQDRSGGTDTQDRIRAQDRPGGTGTQDRPAERTQVISPAALSAGPKPLEPTEPTATGATRAEPRRVPPRPASGAEDPPRPRRRRGLLVAVAIVAVLALGAGVVYLVPGVADKLGISGGTPAVDIAPPAAAVQFTPTLRGPGGGVPAPTAAGVQAALAGPAGNPALGTLTGTVVDPTTGEVLFSRNADTPLVPASTTKVLTTAAALLAIPHAEQLSTRVVQGDKPGTVVIVGGGDVTLSSLAPGESSVYPGAAHLSDLVNQVKATGPVDTVLLDLDRYTGDPLAQGWLPGDVGAGYISPIVPAMLDGGRADPTKAVSARSANPARTLAEEFARRIGATVPAKAVVKAPEGARVLGEVRSAPIVELVDNALQRSDNVLAEALAREVARTVGKEVSFTGAMAAVLDTLKQNGFDTSAVQLSDGSGMSTLNKVTSDLLADVLKVAASPDSGDPRTAKLRPLLGGLPVAGGSGTLARRYQGPAETAGKGWVRAKTGTLSGVNSLAGVVLDSDGRLLVFALMSNGSDPGAAQPALDAVAATLRGCGCR